MIFAAWLFTLAVLVAFLVPVLGLLLRPEA